MEIAELLKKYYGYTSFRGGQEEIIRQILAGRDVTAIMPTGAGKSVCYQLPALALGGITLVVSPLISLMQDQVRSLLAMGVRAAYLNSTLTPRQMQLATENARRGIYKIIYVAPERLMTEEFLRFACEADIKLLAVDEAHCISQWGHDFRPSYLQVGEFVRALPRRPVVAAFTATATERVRQDIITQLGMNRPFSLVTGFDRENLFLGVYQPPDKDTFLLNYVANHAEQSGIIYCGTRKRVDETARLLTDNGYPALPYHAGMNDSDRKHHQEEFIYDRTRLIVATNAFGMGIDKPNVRYVIHYNMPQNLEEYYQQAGRAGRDGEPAECILLYSGRDVMAARYMILHNRDVENEAPEERQKQIDAELEKLKLMTFYAASDTVCLRKRLLNYFGERFSAPCGQCSVCRGDSAEAYSNLHRASAAPEIPVDEALLERLRQYRRQEANRAAVPAFVVLGDAVLRELASRKPRTRTELSRISGMGEAKLNRYGESVLAVICAYEEEADF